MMVSRATKANGTRWANGSTRQTLALHSSLESGMSKGSKDDVTWYVVADGGKARVLTKTKQGMHTVHVFDNSGQGNADNDPAAGRSQLTAPEADPHEQAKLAFEKKVADELNEAVRTGKVDSIVLAAPAHALHQIREHLNKAAKAVLSKSLSKDLTNTPDHELASHFD